MSNLILIDNVQWTLSEKQEIQKISNEFNSGDSYHYSAYGMLNQKINVDRLHEYKKTKKNDLIEFINPNLSHWVLGYFNKAFNVDKYVNIKKACKSGKLPFYCFSKLGKDCTEMQEDKKKGNTYTSKLTDNQIAELDKLVKNNNKVAGTMFNDTVDSFLPAKKSSKKLSEFDKALKHIKSVKLLIDKNGFTVNQKLKLDSHVHAIQALLVVTKVERQGIAKKIKVTA